MRYLVPFFLVAVFVASTLLAARSAFYSLALAAQVCFYALAVVAWVLEAAGLRVRVLALPQYFVVANVASLIACYKFLRGERYARWEPIREASQAQAVTSAVPQGREG
jgi:hypothetical protein